MKKESKIGEWAGIPVLLVVTKYKHIIFYDAWVVGEWRQREDKWTYRISEQYDSHPKEVQEIAGNYRPNAPANVGVKPVEKFDVFLQEFYERMASKDHFMQANPDEDWKLLLQGDTIPYNINIDAFICSWTQDRFRPNHLEVTDDLRMIVFGYKKTRS